VWEGKRPWDLGKLNSSGSPKMRNRVMVSPVSTQVFPIVVVALTLKPSKVVLLTTPKVEIFTRQVRKALLFAGIEVEEREINPYSYESIKEKVKDLHAPFLLLNCGTKFTALSLYRIFKGVNTYYYAPDGRVLDLDGNLIFKVPENLLNVELHSQMYGFEIVEERKDYEIIRNREKLTRYIASHPELLPILSKLHHGKKEKNLPPEFVNLAKNLNVLAYRGGEFVALDREYLGGKWLEEFTFLELLNKDFYDVKINVKVKWYEESVINEVDVVAIRNNRLCLFSCKTGKNVKEVVKHLYELEELTERIGGDFGKSYLVVTENLFKPLPPGREEFPNAPAVEYETNRRLWQEYYRTGEDRRHKLAWDKHVSFKNLSKRARLLGIEILTPKLLERKQEWF